MDATDGPRCRKTSSNKSSKACTESPGSLGCAEVLSEASADGIRRRYEAKVANHESYTLVAAFVVTRGQIEAYFAFRTVPSFELTERRLKIFQRYYRQGTQQVVMYVNSLDFEYYMPVGLGKLGQRTERLPASATKSATKNAAKNVAKNVTKNAQFLPSAPTSLPDRTSPPISAVLETREI